MRYELLLPLPDEDAEALEAELPGEAIDAYVRRVCVLKANAARARLLGTAPVLVADTTVSIDGLILGKPIHEEDAVAMLERLVGREHEVLTTLAVVAADGALLEPALSRSTVRFAAADRAALRRYASTGEPLGKAGA
ncbi:Septum formation protein Maf [Candidatus Paraburkholderia kirkii]|nr:Septum formation protein Maf [Candidatus Paraburkholderia kirkii]